MKLSAFFNGINWVWSNHGFAFLGMVSVIYIAMAYGANHVVRKSRSDAVLFTGFAFALFFVLAMTQSAASDNLFAEPIHHIFIVVLAGVGVEVNRRLLR